MYKLGGAAQPTIFLVYPAIKVTLCTIYQNKASRMSATTNVMVLQPQVGGMFCNLTSKYFRVQSVQINGLFVTFKQITTQTTITFLTIAP